ncbi:tripartite tricarboxylate transporter TctB family protein [Lampropedia puyangensis]|uniref:Tripartite tricarboxylate transporter TctB family protein n=1 Tax=Lampropedia puyangensis TaxID=1330072 RepID=A0A4S8F877_9BURK|nr:tripartite tricarboxylate transporter TctB family protein [Lampropedia puyangensis]THU02494.1 tripartite tricarboxylate transporter TctB family protein [Lampropedia puyangensis]
MKVTRDLHDIIGGLLMTATGLFFAIYGGQYDMGTTARMGPGYFPVALGWTLAVLGILVALPACWRKGSAVVVQWGNLFWSVLAIVIFAAALYPLGVVIASFVAALLSLVPSKMALRTRMCVCAVVALLTTLIFPISLQMVLPIWPWSL